MTYRCERCGRQWDDQSAEANEYFCLRACAGKLVRASIDASDASAILRNLAHLPGILAIPLQQYSAESHPVMKLHRLCDAAEILTRFCVVVALGELRQGLGDKLLPAQLLGQIQPHIERPTFGRWREMLAAILDHLNPIASLVAPELIEFARDRLLPGLRQHVEGLTETLDDGSQRAQNLIDLRNTLVHGGGHPEAWAQRRLEACSAWLERLVDALGFLAEYETCFYDHGRTFRLTGFADLGAEHAVPPQLHQALADHKLDGHVILLRGERCVDLWPLCDYGRGVSTSTRGAQQANADSPLVYVRSEQERLLYVVLGGVLPFSLRTREDRRRIVQEFRRLFQLDERATVGQEMAVETDFEAELRADSLALVGREAELRAAKQAIKQTQSGVLWITGPGGIGKSFLIARLASDLSGDRQPKPPDGNTKRRLCRIAWRFKLSDLTRGNRTIFLRHAVAKLGAWLDKSDLQPAADAQGLYDQLDTLLAEAAQLTPEVDHPDARAPRVLFVLDGLDEIARSDPEFPQIPFRLQRPNVVWLCAGRPEGELPHLFAVDKCAHVFPKSAENPAGGLPRMSKDDIRGMLLDGTGALKYELLPRDREQTDTQGPAHVLNPAVEAVAERAQGLPLFVHYVVQDILSGDFRFADLERQLPQGLSAYYDKMLERYRIGAVPLILTPLVVALAWARAPLEEETLLAILLRRIPDLAHEADPLALVRLGLEAIQSMVRQTAVRGSQAQGYELYHPTFREHIRQDAAKVIGFNNAGTRTAFCNLVGDWRQLGDSDPTRHYVLSHGPSHLLEDERYDELVELLSDLQFVEAKCCAGLTFDLVQDYADALGALPELQEEKQQELARQARCQRYAQELIVYSRRWREALDLHRENPQTYPVPASETIPLPTPPESCAIRTDVGIEEQAAKEAERSPHASRLRAFGNFVYAHGDVLNSFPDVTIPMARNHACDGPVAERADSLLAASFSRAWLAREPRPPAPSARPVCLRTLEGHSESVVSVAISPDGLTAVSASEDSTIRIWDLIRGYCLHTLTGHRGPVLWVSLGLDGRIAVSAGHDSTLRLWDLGSGACLETLKGHRGWATSAALSADGRTAVSAGTDRRIRFWDLGSGRCLRRLKASGKPMLFTSQAFLVALSPDGLTAVSATYDWTVQVWDLVANRCVRTLDGHNGFVSTLAISPDGRTVVSGSTDRTLRVWDLSSGCCLRTLEGHGGVVNSVSLSADSRIAVSASDDKTLRVWDLVEGYCLRALEGHGHWVLSVALAPDGRTAVSASEDKTLRIWDLTSDCAQPEPGGHCAKVTSVVMGRAGRTAVSASADNCLRVWDTECCDHVRTLMGHTDKVVSLAISLDGRTVLSGSKDKTLRLWDTKSGDCLLTLEGHTSEVGWVGISSDGRTAASASVDTTIRVWDTTSGRCVHTLKTESYPRSVVYSLDLRTAVTLGSHATILKVWDLVSGCCVRRLEGHRDWITTLAISHDGRTAVSGNDKTVRVWDLSGGGCIRTFEGPKSITSITLSHDGRTALSAGWSDTLRVWDLEDGLCLRTLDGPSGFFVFRSDGYPLVLSADGRIAVTATDYRTLRVWQVDSGRQLTAYFGYARIVSISEINVHGRFACGTDDGQVHLLTLRNLPSSHFS